MPVRKQIVLATATALALGACSAENTTVYSWRQPAGAFLDEGQFGNPTMTNQLVHRGDATFVASLNNRFSTEVDPMVNFAFDSATLDVAARTTLYRQAAWIRQFPEVRFKVYGHTDLVGSQSYNQRLGQQRAQAVVNFFVSQGIDRRRLQAAVSFGETQPVIVTEGRERRNRRTITEVVGFVNGNPSVLNGKYAEIIFREYVASGVPSATLSDTQTQLESN